LRRRVIAGKGADGPLGLRPDRTLAPAGGSIERLNAQLLTVAFTCHSRRKYGATESFGALRRAKLQRRTNGCVEWEVSNCRDSRECDRRPSAGAGSGPYH